MDYLAAAGIGGLVVIAALGWGVVAAVRAHGAVPPKPTPLGPTPLEPVPLRHPPARPLRPAPVASGPKRPPSAAAEAQRELFRVVAAARRTA